MKLKPCPFCGGKADWCMNVEKDGHECHLIQCTNCGILVDSVAPGICNAETLEECRNALSQRWNNRPAERHEAKKS